MARGSEGARSHSLADDERRLYDATWREFRREFGLAGGSTRRAAGLGGRSLVFGKRRACSALLAQQPSPTTSSQPASRSQYLWRISKRVLSWRKRYAVAGGACVRPTGRERHSSTKRPHCLSNRRLRRRGVHGD